MKIEKILSKKLPEDWKFVSFQEVAEIITGNTPSRKKAENYGEGIPWVKPPDLDQVNPIFRTTETLSEIGQTQARVLPKNSVLVCCIGSIGRVGIAGTELATNQQINSLIFNETIVDPKFGYFYCQSIQEIFKSKAEQAVVKILNKSQFSKISIPLPPLSEQRKIVEILDQADALRTKRAESDRLSDRILPALFIKMFGDPIINPMRWPTKNLEEITDIKNIRNGISPSHKGTYSEKVLTLSAITQGKFNANAHKVAGFSKKPSKHKLVRKNDFLVCRGNGNINLVGQGKFPNNDYDDLYFPDTIIAVPIDYSICQREYLETIWSHEVVRQQIETLARTTNGTYKINQSSLLSMKILLPPPDLQEKFCLDTHKLHQVLALQSITVSKIEKLFQTLLHQAFTGTLTASWRTAHMTELLQEMEHQAKQLNLDLSPTP